MVPEGSDRGEGRNSEKGEWGPNLNGSKLALLNELERGPFGILYRARDGRSGQDISLRVPPPHWPQESSMLAATRASSLKHPHIASVLEAGWHDGVTYIIMGEELGAPVRPGGLPPGEAIVVVRDAATAVAYAASQNVAHPGLVPDLLRFTPQGRVVVTGYELPGVAASSDPYRAPEVRHGGDVDEAANVYSLGAILYALIAGREPDPHSPQPPFQFDSRVPDGLEKPIREAMHVDPKRRPTAAALAEALTCWIELQPMPEVLPDPPAPGRRAWNEAIVITGLLALLLLGLLSPIPGGNAATPSIPTQAREALAFEPSIVAVAPVDPPEPTPEPAPAEEVDTPRHEPPETKVVEPTPPSPPDPTPPAPARVGTVMHVHSEYGVFVALEAPSTVGVGEALEAVREGSPVTALKVRKLSRPEKLYPYGAAVCDASDPVVLKGQIVRRPKP